MSEIKIVEGERKGWWYLLQALFYIFSASIFNPVTLVLGIIFEKSISKLEKKLPYLAFSSVYIVFWIELFERTSLSTFWLWVLLVGISPFVGFIHKAGTTLLRWIRPIMDVHEKLAEIQKREERKNKSLSNRAGRVYGEAVAGKIYLGNLLRDKGGDVSQMKGVESDGIKTYLTDKSLNQHMFIVGMTGAGKTQTLIRIVHDILNTGERDVFIIDGKGELELALKMKGLGERFGLTAPIYKLGHKKRGAIYNAFNGSADSVYNRLTAIIGVQNVEGNALFYADKNRNLLQLICYALDEDGNENPPRSFTEVRDRLDKIWLLQAYKDDERERKQSGD